MRLWLLFLISIFLIQHISASCSENQVDVNTASLEQLDTLTGIGPAKAQEIVNARPFKTVDDLINVKGIGEKTLESIKAQGIACVENEDNNEKKEEIKPVKEETKQIKEEIPEEKLVEFEAINLNPKAIKTEAPKESLKKNFALSGLGVFCVLLAALFIIKRKKYKNEFR